VAINTNVKHIALHRAWVDA